MARLLLARGTVLIALAMLAGCSWMTAAPEPQSPALQSEQARSQLSAWQFKGRIQTEDRRASLRWRQSSEQFDLLLRGAFGFGGVRIIGNPLRVEINDGEEIVVSHDPVVDIYQRTGLVVPLAALRYWALGLPAPQEPAQVERNVAGYIQRIQQAGWQVELGDYQDEGGIAFPFEIQLMRAGQSFVISVSQWKML